MNLNVDVKSTIGKCESNGETPTCVDVSQGESCSSSEASNVVSTSLCEKPQVESVNTKELLKKNTECV